MMCGLVPEYCRLFEDVTGTSMRNLEILSYDKASHECVRTSSIETWNLGLPSTIGTLFAMYNKLPVAAKGDMLEGE